MTEPTSLFKREPIIILAFVMWVLTNVGTILVGHTHLVTSSQWNAVSTYVAPLATAFALSTVAVVFRRFVAPVWRLADQEATRLGATFPEVPAAGTTVVPVAEKKATPAPVDPPTIPASPVDADPEVVTI